MRQFAASDGQPGNWEDPGFHSASALDREVSGDMAGRSRMNREVHVRLCVQIRLRMFSRSQSCQGKNQKPCSLDGRYEGNRLSSPSTKQSVMGLERRG